MSQNVIIGGVAVVILLGAGVWWYQSHSGTEEVMNSQTNGEAVEEPGVLEALSGRFTDFMRQGDSVQCSFSGTDPDTNEYAEGTVYASGDEYYIEVNTAVEGTPVAMKMIQTDNTMYLWSDNPEVVPAMSFELEAFAGEDFENAPFSSSPTEWLDEPEVEVEYSCRRWSPRVDSFVPPADIDFMNPFSAMMEMMGGMEGMMTEEMVQMMQNTQ